MSELAGGATVNSQTDACETLDFGLTFKKKPEGVSRSVTLEVAGITFIFF